MKKIIIAFIICTLSAVIHAQDIIVYANGNTITAKILEISDTQIKYKNYNNLSGPTYVAEKASVIGINYANGYNERFNNANTSTVMQSTPTMIVQDTGVANNDNLLLKQYDIYGKKAKKYKTLGWSFLAGGVLLGAACLASQPSDRGQEDAGNTETIAGGVIMLVGVTTGTCLLVKAHQYAKQNKYFAETVPVFQVPLNLANNKNIMASFDIVKDNVSKKTLPGIGLSYNF